jgi:hypothetical protein
VSSLWSISNQFNNFELNNGQWSNNWNFQPVLPVSLTKDWNLITRPVMPWYNIGKLKNNSCAYLFDRLARCRLTKAKTASRVLITKTQAAIVKI